MTILELNDGWTQIPPKEDGEYWMARAKPWHSENAYDLNLLLLVRIKDGKRIEEMESYDEKWHPPECDDPTNPVWDAKSQFEILAAWRPKLDGENFKNLPPKITEKIFERHPAKCPTCGKVAVAYRVHQGAQTLRPPREMPRGNPVVCHSCGFSAMLDKDYFDKRFVAAFKAALEAKGVI